MEKYKQNKAIGNPKVVTNEENFQKSAESLFAYTAT